MTLSLARLGFMGGAGALGKLELIQTQTVTSAVSYVDFLDNLGTYKTHLLTFQNVTAVLYAMQQSVNALIAGQRSMVSLMGCQCPRSLRML